MLQLYDIHASRIPKTTVGQTVEPRKLQAGKASKLAICFPCAFDYSGTLIIVILHDLTIAS
jgi:hypothetical protein